MDATARLSGHLADLTRQTGIVGEVVEQDAQLLVILHNVPLPAGRYTLETTDVLFITDKQYPLSALDMFWVDVAVLRPDGSIPQAADSIEHYNGRDWRRFSWHRNSSWNINGNPLLDHYAFMERRFADEPLVQEQAA